MESKTIAFLAGAAVAGFGLKLVLDKRAKAQPKGYTIIDGNV